MKSIRIGRSSKNDIVINDVTVSSQHAIIIILDTKEVRIKDLNSTNGTYINGKRITTETIITTSDIIKVGSTTLDWLKYLNEKKKPMQPTFRRESSAIKNRKNIGRTVDNDIVFKHKDVSSHHAQLIKKETGEIVIADSGSTNGTYVNGQKISMQTLRAGDRVLIANKYPLDWQSVFDKIPNPPKPKNIKPFLIAALSIAVVFIFIFFLNQKTIDPKPWTPEQTYSYYKKSVVLIMGSFYYEAKAKDYIWRFTLNGNGEICDLDDNNGPMGYTGTGFFISEDGKILTNRHVVVPWMGKESTIETIKTMLQKYIAQLSLTNERMYLELQPLIGDVKVEGKLYDIGICLNDVHISGWNELIPCNVLKESGDNKVDVGLIQVNNKTLPAGVEHIIDLSSIDNDITVGEKLYTIGFPTGLTLALTEEGIEANNQSGEVTQTRGDVEFGHNITIIGGASGSPVFNEYGQLIGIINAGYTGSQGYNMAVKAKYAVELAK